MAFNNINEEVEKFKTSDEEIMFIHIREPEEIERAKIFFNAKTLLIKRVGLQNIKTNYSDANVDNYNYDYEIENTTLEDLDKQAELFINNLTSTKNKYLIKKSV